MPFEKNVFINCPFDAQYKKYLKSILFTLIYCDFVPKISETKDSGANRLNEIVRLIRESKLSIHDLSRMQAKKAGELARFNMPFELGIEIGFRHSGVENFAIKRCLVIDKRSYRYQASLSDMAGNDIENYGSNTEKLIRVIRNWLIHHNGTNNLPGASQIWLDYTEFSVDLESALEKDGFSKKDKESLPRSEFIRLAQDWIKRIKSSRA